MLENLRNRKLILASRSPRRRHLLDQLGLEFSAIDADIDESFPPALTPDETAIYIAEKKANHFANQLEDPANIIITADTLVLINGQILGKPADRNEARKMLSTLSGKMHQVVTGICIRSCDKSRTFTSWTDVYFKELSEEEIEYYIDNYQPYDKAGAYGAQEWIGYIGISRLEGSYFNVMGLPIDLLYEELKQF
jgi:septum formation protein